MKIILCAVSVLLLCFFAGCVEYQTTQPEIITVKIIPLSELDDAPEAAFFWEKQKVLFPQIEIPNPLPKEIPHKNNWLLVSLENDGEIKVDNEKVADLSNLELLQFKLKRIFLERENNKTYEPNSNKISKLIIFKGLRQAKYSDIYKVIRAIKASDANPIFIQIDDLQQTH